MAASSRTPRLDGLLARGRRRIRLSRGVATLAVGLAGGGLLGLVLVVLTKVSLVPGWVVWVGVVAPLVMASAFAAQAAARPITPLQAAQVVDEGLDLKEVLTAACDVASQTSVDSQMAALVLERGEEAAGNADLRRAVALPRPRGIWPALALGLVPLALFFLPVYVPESVAEARAQREQAGEVASELVTQAEELAKAEQEALPGGESETETETEPDEDTPAKTLEAAAREVRESPDDPEAARKELAQLQDRLEKMAARRDQLDSSKALADASASVEEDSPASELADALASGSKSADDVSQALAQKLDMGQFQRQQAQQLASDLEALAEAMRQAGQSDAADQLEAAARALRNGDQKGAADALAKANLDKAMEAMAKENPLRKMGEELQANKDTSHAGRGLSQGKLGQTAEGLEGLAQRMDRGELSDEDLKALGETLNKTAAHGVDDPVSRPIAQPLDKAAKKIARGNIGGAAEALRRVARGLAESQRRMEQAAQAADALRRARAALGMGGGGAPLPKMQWRDLPPGARRQQGGSRGVGSGPGQGSTGEENPAFQVPSGPEFDRQTERTSDWREAYREAYAPEEAAGSALNTQVEGQVSQGQVQSRQVEVPVAPGEARAPVVRVPDAYQKAAEDAVSDPEIPADQAETVRRYFEGLSQ